MEIYPSFAPKDADATLDYIWDWDCWLQGDVLASAQFAVIPDNGLTVLSASIDPATNRALVWLTGGTPDQNYQVTCHITTSGGRIDDRSVYIRISDR